MSQNTSHAVMAQRSEPKDSLDDFPTPPWATRALMNYVVGTEVTVSRWDCLEPACGRGHMAQTLREYFGAVHDSDIQDYGGNPVEDFLKSDDNIRADWIITNPPFNLAEQFAIKALKQARCGVALLTRTVFIESVGRYYRLFNTHKPSCVAQFSERVPMVRGRLDKKASTATGYAWIIWEKHGLLDTELLWIPPCRKLLEKTTDYAPEFLLRSHG